MDKIIMNTKERKQMLIFDKVVQGEITQKMAAQRLNLSERWIRNKLKRYRARGAEGLVHRNRGKESARKWSSDEEKLAIDLIKSDWQGFGPSFAAEKLKERFNIIVSRETLRKSLTRNGLWKAKHSRPKHRLWRERKVMRGIMVQLDGSPHDWFEGRAPYCTLLVFIDDATSEVLWLEFAKSESINSVMTATRSYFETHGIPQSFYVDYGSVFSVNLNNVERKKKTQFERANDELGVKIIHARSAQAKGRVERVNGTLQDRLVKEMRLRGISSMDEANLFIKNEYLAMHNKKFAISAAKPGDAHVHLDPAVKLDTVFCIKQKRIITNDYTISYKRRIVQLLKEQRAFIRPKYSIDVYEHLDGRISLWKQKTPLNFKEVGMRKKTTVSPVEYVNASREDETLLLGLESRVKPAMPAVEAALK